MEVDIIITVSIAFGLIFTIGQIARIIRIQTLHRTLRKAIEHGQPLTADVIEGLERAPEPGSTDRRIGFVLIAAGLAVLAAGAMGGSVDNFRQLASIALFPLFIGGALLLRLRIASRHGAES